MADGMTETSRRLGRGNSGRPVNIRQLRHWIISYATLGVLLMVFISAALVILPVYSQLRAARDEQLQQVVRTETAAIEQLLYRARSIAWQVTSRTRARELLRKLSRGEITTPDFEAESREILLDALRLADEVDGITRLNADGVVVVAVGHEIPSELWPDAATDGVVIVGPRELRGVHYLVVRAPIRNEAGELLGSDLLLVRFAGVTEILKHGGHTDFAGRSFLGIYHETGSRIVYVDPALAKIKIEAVPPHYLALIRRSLGSEKGVVRHVEEGNRQLLAFAPVAGTSWVVIVATDADMVYGRGNRQLLMALGAVAVLALISAAGMYFLVRPLASGMLVHVDSLEARVREATAALEEELAERKQVEMQLRKAGASLAESNKELEQFAYVASHDLQEPLRTVSSFATLLGRRYQGKLDQAADEFIGFIVDGAKRGQRLISDLLDYSRVATRGKPPEQVMADQVLDEVIAGLKFSIDETEAVVQRSPLPCVMADRTQLGQLFQNLISNALKFRREGGPPVISIKADVEADGWCCFQVRDNGVGIAEKDQDRVFDVFQRLHGPEVPGTGMGLATCRKIVERHGGRIWVESTPGEGAVFKFTLKMCEA